MKLLDTIARRAGFIPQKVAADRERNLLKKSARSFAAAQISRLSADFQATMTTIDMDIRTGGRVVRERARDLAKNNDYGKRYLNLVRTNVVGPDGFKLQMNVKEWAKVNGELKYVSDQVANQKIIDAFKTWSRAEYCSVDGRNTFRGLQDMMVRYASRDGEAFVRLVRDQNVRFGLRIQLIEPEMIDDLFNARLDSGNVVKMGVEVNEWRRPVAYWVKKQRPEYDVYGGTMFAGERERIPVSEIIHGFDQEYAYQTRGISWMVQSMLRLKMLSGYEEAALTNARISAAKMGFFTSNPEDGAEFSGEKDANDNFVMDAEPGSMEQLPPGLDFKPWAPEYPTAQHEMFVNSILRGVSSGLGVSFNLLGNNLEKVNYSSIRAGVMDERELWKLIQAWFEETFLRPIFAAWLEMALLTGEISLPMSKFDKFNNPIWVGRRWAWVDPLKDVEAKILEVQAGFTTATQVVAETGWDIDDIYAELAEEKEKAKAAGLNLKLDEIKTAGSGAPAAPAEDPQPDANKALRDLAEGEDGDDAYAWRILESVRGLLKPTNGNGVKHG